MIVIKECSKVYLNGKVGIQNVNLKLPNKGLIGIFGESGSGKSTLINCLGGLDSFTNGQVYIDNNVVKDLRKFSTYVFQEFKLLEELTIYENILFSIEKQSDTLNTDKILSKLGILDIKHSKVNAISGGQRQRVAIARAVIQNVPIIICDEPTASLDTKTSNEIFSLLKELSKDKLIIVVSHHIEILENYTNQLIQIDKSQVVKTFECIDTQSSNYKPAEEIKLSNDGALKLGLNNLRHNKIKAIMTAIFLFISLTAVALLTTILFIDIDKISYATYKKNKIEFVQFNTYGNDMKEISRESIPKRILDKMKPEIVSYDHINFSIKYQHSIRYFNSIWVVQGETFRDIRIKKNEVIISKGVAKQLSNDTDSLISDFIHTVEGDLVIIDFLEYEDRNILVMNHDTFETHNSNLLEDSDLIVRLANESYPRYNIYNPYNEYNNVKIKYGTLPVRENEACLPLTLLNLMYPGIDPSTLIGKSVNIDISMNEIEDTKKTSTEQLVITGYTDHGFIFSDSRLAYYISKYGTSSINAGTCGAIYFDYTLDTFKTATVNLVLHEGKVSDDLYFIYTMLRSFTGILISLAIVFGVITLFTVINSVSTSMLKSKKDLGVLICFNIKKNNLGKIFLFENVFVGIIATLCSIVAYAFLLVFINSKINTEWNMNVSILHFNMLIIIILIAVSVTLVFGAISIPLMMLRKKHPIDILYER